MTANYFYNHDFFFPSLFTLKKNDDSNKNNDDYSEKDNKKDD